MGVGQVMTLDDSWTQTKLAEYLAEPNNHKSSPDDSEFGWADEAGKNDCDG